MVTRSPISPIMSIPPTRRYTLDSPVVHGKLTALGSCRHRHARLENKPISIRIADGQYKVPSFVCMSEVVEWHNFAHKNKEVLLFVTNLGLLSFMTLNWANPMAAPRMELVQEFVNATDVDDKTAIMARVRGLPVRIIVELIHSVLKLPIGLIMDPLVQVDHLADYRALQLKYRVPNAKSDKKYMISKCSAKFRPHLKGIILRLRFKCKITYVSNKTFWRQERPRAIGRGTRHSRCRSYSSSM